MFQERYNRIILPFFFILDIIIAVSLFSLWQCINKNNFTSFLFLFYIAIFWAVPALYFRSYRAPRGHSSRAAFKPTFFTWCVFTILFLYSISFGLIGSATLINHFLFLLSLGLVQHSVSFSRFQYFHQYRLKGKNSRRVLFIGSKHNIDKIKKDSLHYGYKILHTIKNLNSLEDLFAKEKFDLVFLRDTGDDSSKKVSQLCDSYGVRLKLLLNIDPNTSRKTGLDIIGGFAVVDVRKEPLLYLGNRTLKRLVDIFMSAFSMIFILTWLPIVVKVAQILSYRGPLFFIQKRIGRDGKIFNLYKFRTMFHTNEAQLAKDGHAVKTSNDDARIPWFGKFLRKTNLDEYPQFLNVFLGSMSTVGPRPHMVGEDNELAENLLNYKVRRFVKPGITGWAAANGYRGGTDNIDLMSKRTELDIWYLENWSLWLDIKIMAITIWQMVRFRIPKAY